MKRFVPVLALFCLFLLVLPAAHASHIYGGELTYRQLGNDSLRLELSLFADCATCTAPCLITDQTVRIFNNNTELSQVELHYIPNSDQEITPVCPSSISQTACNNPVNPTLPGIRRLKYARNIRLSLVSSKIAFEFILCCRTANITNLINPSSTRITLRAELDNTVFQNSSPEFTTVPTPFYCVYEPQQYNPGAVDPDGDSLAFEMVSALNITNPANYVPGYSGNTPLACAPGSFSLNSQNGQINFTPSQLQRPVVVQRITEYRKGVRVGSSMREMTFVVQDNCGNQPPAGTSIINVTGGTFSNNTIQVCKGSQVGFQLAPTDADGDNLNLTVSGVPAGAVVSISNNNTPNPVLSFNWTLSGSIAPGSYSLFVTVQDNHCPLNAKQNVAVTLQVGLAGNLNTQVLSPPSCIIKGRFRLSPSGSGGPWNIAAVQGATTVKTWNNIATGTSQIDSLPAGSYLLYFTNTATGCGDTTTLHLDNPDAPPMPVAPAVTYCLNDPGAPLTATALPGHLLKWYNQAIGGSELPLAPVPNTSVPGTTTWYVSQSAEDCESKRLAVPVTVFEKPPLPVVPGMVVLCRNETATPLTATGQNLKWYSTATGGTGNTNAPVPTTTTSGIWYYYVSQSINGCESDRAAVQVEVREKPIGALHVARYELCRGDTLHVRYTGTGLSTYTYTWNLSPGTVLLSGAGAGPVVLRFDAAGPQTVGLKIDNAGCTSPLSQIITVRQSPELGIGMKREACVGETVEVGLSRAEPAGLSNYRWTFSGGDIVYAAAESGPYGIRWNGSGTRVVTVRASGNGCSSPEYTDTIQVREKPEVRLQTGTTAELCLSDSLLLSTVEREDYRYQWTPAAFFSKQSAARVFARVLKQGYIHLQVTDEIGCTAADSIYIRAKACCEVLLPDAFTPNNDGRNDVFRIISKAHQSISSFRVLNRWGQVVWETANDRQGWDGTLGGLPQAMGTYYYFLKYTCANGREYEQKGEITLLR